MQTKTPPGFNIHSYQYGLIESAKGNVIDLHNPAVSNFQIEDIAIGLSNICRFGGQIKQFYSVAQHSVFVMHLAPEHLKREALMHDAAEAYLGDVVKPLKHILGPVYEEKEFHFMVVLCDRFGLDFKKLDEIKKYDLIALELEAEALQKSNPTPMVISMNMHGMMDEQPHCFWDNITARVQFFQACQKLQIL